MTTPSADPDPHRRRYQIYLDRMSADPTLAELLRAGWSAEPTAVAEAVAIRDALVRTGDADSFRLALQKWSLKPNARAFNGFSGQVFVNQLFKNSHDHGALGRILSATLTPPQDDADAADKIRTLAAHVETLRVGRQPSPGHAPFLLSFFWALDDRTRWPVMWITAVQLVEHLTGQPLSKSPTDRYGQFAAHVRDLDPDFARFERVALWNAQAGRQASDGDPASSQP